MRTSPHPALRVNGVAAWAALLALSLGACGQGGDDAGVSLPGAETDRVLFDSWERSATGTEFMVAAPTPEAVDAGVAVLERGGNALDAAVAVAAALWVTDPAMASVGGRAQILVRLADGHFIGIDGASPKQGFTAYFLESAVLVRKMAEQADQAIAIGDSSKFGKHGFARILPFEGVDVLVTDTGLEERFEDELSEAGVTVIKA